MKSNHKLLIITSIVVVVMMLGFTKEGQSQSCSYGWATQTSGTLQQLFSVSTVSSTVAWVSGSNSTVRRTIDGSTWIDANPNSGLVAGDVRCVCGIDANIALCSVSPAAAYIYKTVNGGVNWTQVYSENESAIYCIRMISATEGYALGGPHPVGTKWTILKTIDGGSTWARIPTEPLASSPLEAGFNNSFQILGTNMWFGTNTSRVYHSTDMGATWSSSETPGTLNTYSIHYNDPMMGLAGGDNPTGNSLDKSTDGGATYSSATAPPPGGIVNGIAGFGSNWWLIRSNVDILHSTDQGSSWNSEFSQGVGIFHSIDLIRESGCPTGWAVGNGGVIAKMTIITGIITSGNGLPDTYTLSQNYPNPFNPSTNISYSIPKQGMVVLKIYDMIGKEVQTLVNEVKAPGDYIVSFNAFSLPSGIYFYRLESENFTDTKKMTLVK